MTTSEIEVLLERYYEGDTSLREEQALRDYFRMPDVPEHLKPHQKLFAYFGDEQLLEAPGRAFDQKLTARLTAPSGGSNVVRMYPARSRHFAVYGVAASILLLFGIFFTFQQDVFKRSGKQIVSRDAEVAYADAREALYLVSGNLNYGLKQCEHLQMVDKAMKNMELFNKFYQYETIITNPDVFSNKSIKSK